MDGRLLVGVIVWTPAPGMANATVSTTVGAASPAAHSPAAAPEAVLLLAACIASRRVHSPSLPSTASAVLLTVIVLAEATGARTRRPMASTALTICEAGRPRS